jgi:aldehyde dehydrogenase (NAD+)
MQPILSELGIDTDHPGTFDGDWHGAGKPLSSDSPIDGSELATVRMTTPTELEAVLNRASKAFETWSRLPAPRRGEIIRQLGQALREKKEPLGRLVTLEMGKIEAEGQGEVQEMIDICDFAVGLSRQLYGRTMPSERPEHRMFEQWHPLGVVGVISAFNFPVAVWSWNAAIGAVCGNAMVWKPSEKTPLTAIATTKIAAGVCEANGIDPAIFSLVTGTGRDVGEPLIHDHRIKLISATGSCRMGRRVAEVAGQRLCKTILELGGNNAIVLTPHADMTLATQATVFGAVGTAGQRCTTTRRLIVHTSVRDEMIQRLIAAYQQVRIGNPLDPQTLMGPLIDKHAVSEMQRALGTVRQQGGEVLYGGQPLSGDAFPGDRYVEPCIVSAPADLPAIQQETFAPILYVIGYDTLEEAIAIHNNVPQGLSSAIFTNDLREAERFLSSAGSDCGIANVNVGTSGAEIGGAFGGEKDTGGGRESGSDAWKAYMRRQTNTVNYSSEMPLAQGIRFGN